MSQADDATLTPGRAKFIGLAPGSLLKRMEVGWDGGPDAIGRSCEVVLDKETKKVVGLVFLAGRTPDGVHRDSYCYRIDPKGALKTVAITHGIMKDGKPVKGSGTVEILDENAPGIRGKLQSELDFWLKGKYRKSAGIPSAAPAASVP